MWMVYPRARGYDPDMDAFTVVNLDSLDDMAPKFGFGEQQEARFATKALGGDQTGLAYIRVKPQQVQPFAHRHEEQEELYVVVEGSGTAVLDEERVELHAHDALRMAPRVARRLEAGPQGMTVLCFGAPAVSGGSNDAQLLEDGDGA
jgi:mannose-6-phosphate isomerase-like protein (cupin superfamily)